MGQDEKGQRSQDLELLDDFVEFDKETLLRIIDNCEVEAKNRIRQGNINLSDKEIEKGARMLRRGLRLMDTKTLWAIVFQLKKELDTLIYLQKMKKEISKPTVITKSGAEMFYNIQFDKLNLQNPRLGAR